MRKFFIKLGLLLLLFLLIDRIAGEVMKVWSRALMPDQRIGSRLLSGTITEKQIILGSSRAAHNLVAAEIESGTGITTYNIGVPGSNVDFHTQLFKLMLSNGNIPGTLLLAIDRTELMEIPKINFRFDLFYPLASDERICRILVERGHLNPLLTQLFHTYREKLGFIEVFRPYALFRKPEHEIRKDGSAPLVGRSPTYKEMKFDDQENIYKIQNESPRLKESFTELLTLCRKHGIKLVLILSPNYNMPSEGFPERMKSLAGEDAVFLDYSRRPEFKGKEMYYDYSHLNADGAMLLSKMIGEDLRNITTSKARR